MTPKQQKEQVSAIIYAVVNRKPRYWLDDMYVRWRRVELDLHATT